MCDKVRKCSPEIENSTISAALHHFALQIEPTEKDSVLYVGFRLVSFMQKFSDITYEFKPDKLDLCTAPDDITSGINKKYSSIFLLSVIDQYHPASRCRVLDAIRALTDIGGRVMLSVAAERQESTFFSSLSYISKKYDGYTYRADDGETYFQRFYTESQLKYELKLAGASNVQIVDRGAYYAAQCKFS